MTRKNNHLKKLALTFFIAGILFYAQTSFAVCKGGFIDPINDIRWSCTMPITIAGITFADTTSSAQKMAGIADKALGAGSPICMCADQNIMGLPRVGITFGINVVFRLAEAVKDPFCFPTLGMQIKMGKYGTGGADTGEQKGGKTTFNYTHFIAFLPTQLMSLFVDSLCMQLSDTNSPFSVLYLSELMPQARSAELALILAPESVLFANPIAQAYCMVDSVLTVAEFTDPIGYWCVGGHSVFPLSNHSIETDYVDASSINIAKILFTLSRTGQLFSCFGSKALCSCVPTFIWNKMEYRFQIAKPVADVACRRMGKPSLLWNTPNKNPALISGGKEDNLLFMVWRRRDCCAL